MTKILSCSIFNKYYNSILVFNRFFSCIPVCVGEQLNSNPAAEDIWFGYPLETPVVLDVEGADFERSGCSRMYLRLRWGSRLLELSSDASLWLGKLVRVHSGERVLTHGRGPPPFWAPVFLCIIPFLLCLLQLLFSCFVPVSDPFCIYSGGTGLTSAILFPASAMWEKMSPVKKFIGGHL